MTFAGSHTSIYFLEGSSLKTTLIFLHAKHSGSVSLIGAAWCLVKAVCGKCIRLLCFVVLRYFFCFCFGKALPRKS